MLTLINKLNLRVKLFIPTLITVSLLAVGIFYIINLEYELFAQQEANEWELHCSEFKNNLLDMASETERLANFIAQDWRVADALLMDNRDTLLDLLQPFYEGLSFDWLSVYNPQGDVFVRIDQPHFFGIKDALYEPVMQAFLKPPKHPQLILLNDQLMIVHLTLMEESELGANAVMAVGYALTRAHLRKFTAHQHNDRDFGINLRFNEKFYLASSDKMSWESLLKKPEYILQHNFRLDAPLGNAQNLEVLFWEIDHTRAEFTKNLRVIVVILSLISALAVWLSHYFITHTALSLSQTNTALKKAKRATEAANEQLSASQSRFQALADTSPNGIFQTDKQGHCTYTNQRWREISGLTETETLGQGWAKALHPEDQDRLVQSWLNAVEQSLPWKDEGRLLRPNKEVRWALLSAALELDQDGKINSFVGSAADITERKSMELELQQAKENAEAASLAKSTFLANMSHELRTPLNGILGYTQILQRERGLTLPQKEGVALIHRSGEHLLTLINDILDLSKIEAGRMELYPNDFSLGSFLSDIVEMFKIRALQKSLEFRYESSPTLPNIVYADEKRLRQLLMNLLGNSVKFTEQGYVNLQVHYDADSQDLRIDIVDTGCGIASDQLNEIFSPFRQAGSILHKAQGTGLGLSITKRLVEMMDGEIGVDSETDKGSRFWFKVPLPISEHYIEPEVTHEFENITGYSSTLANHPAYHILVVDDTEDNRLVVRNLLIPLGFEISQATNGREAIDQVYSLKKPDLILMDLMMPILDGFETAQRLRLDKAFQHTPIIAISASVFGEHIKASQEAGCTDFLPKPFKTEQLLNCLEKYLALTWLYEEKIEVSDSTLEQQNTIKVSEINLTAYQAGVLLEFAKMGDIMEIYKYVDELQAMEPGLRPTLEKISTLAKKFDDDGIIDIVQPYCE